MHENALTSEAAGLLPQFSKFEGFYLVGGTALALQMGHRLSVDFDFFSQKELPQNILQKAKRAFPGSSTAVTYHVPGQLNLLIDGIQTTFFHYPYPVLDPFVTYQNVSLASIREVAAMKALAIGKRLAYKDYVDWYFMLRENLATLEDIISFSKKKFGSDFNDRLFLGQLVTVEDIPNQEINFLRNPVERGTVEQFLEETVRGFRMLD